MNNYPSWRRDCAFRQQNHVVVFTSTYNPVVIPGIISGRDIGYCFSIASHKPSKWHPLFVAHDESNIRQNIICYSGSSQGIQVHVPSLFYISHELSGEGDIEHKQGIWTHISCEDQIPIILYWSAPIK